MGTDTCSVADVGELTVAVPPQAANWYPSGAFAEIVYGPGSTDEGANGLA